MKPKASYLNFISPPFAPHKEGRGDSESHKLPQVVETLGGPTMGMGLGMQYGSVELKEDESTPLGTGHGNTNTIGAEMEPEPTC